VETAKTPRPAHPTRRREPLPACAPKPASEDPEAPRRIAAILASPSYRVASEDLAFLSGESARGLRLQMDYQKPEELLRAQGVREAVVVFGSARIPEPAAAAARLEMARAALAAAPHDAQAQARVAIAERVAANSRYYEVAREFGRRVGRDRLGDGDGVTIVTGGGPGLMEAANRGAFDVGANSVGLNIELPQEQFPNPYVTPDLCFDFHYFAMRKLHFLQRAVALVAFPGGFGTLDELFEVLTLAQTRKIAPIPIVLVGESFWRRAVDFDFLLEEGVIAEEDLELFGFAETADEIWSSIDEWRRAHAQAYGAEGGMF
jgi:uncharacterized protein (TIGR00730 family)